MGMIGQSIWRRFSVFWTIGGRSPPFGRVARADTGRAGGPYRFMMAIAGNLPGYEEGLRALFADDQGKLEQCIAAWPEDIRTYAIRLAFGETNQL